MWDGCGCCCCSNVFAECCVEEGKSEVRADVFCCTIGRSTVLIFGSCFCSEAVDDVLGVGVTGVAAWAEVALGCGVTTATGVEETGLPNRDGADGVTDVDDGARGFDSLITVGLFAACEAFRLEVRRARTAEACWAGL